ncbi:ABC transporter transmembrane domain-containing protein [Rhodobacteraceae bacterium]|nr:ABC transporter transmembrane domain-containing protein [Paracoccaceae bacterium]
MVFSGLIRKFTELGPIKDFPNHFKILHSYIGNKIFGMFFLSVLASLLETAGIALFVSSIANGFINENEKDPFSSTNLIFSQGFIQVNFQQALILCLFIFAIKSMFVYSAYHMSANIRSSLIIDIKNKLVRNYVDTDYETFLKQDIGHMTNLVGEQTYRFNQFYFYLNQFLVAIFTGITFFLAALFVAPKIGLLLLLNMFIVFTLFKTLASKVQRMSKLVVYENSKITAATLEMLNNMKYVKSTGSDQRFLSRVARSAENLAFYQGLSWKYSGLLIAAKEPILFMSIILIIIIQSIFGLTMVSAVTSIILFYRALNYLIVANNSIQTTTEFSGSFLQIHRELESRDAKTTKRGRKQNALMPMPKISFKDKVHSLSKTNLVTLRPHPSDANTAKLETISRALDWDVSTLSTGTLEEDFSKSSIVIGGASAVLHSAYRSGLLTFQIKDLGGPEVANVRQVFLDDIESSLNQGDRKPHNTVTGPQAEFNVNYFFEPVI